jgi:hypothetical protein
MSATKKQRQPVIASAVPEIAVPTAERAISIVNRWLHTDVAMLTHVSRAVFDPATYCWHLPVQLSYPQTGPLGIIGDVYLDARNGQFAHRPGAKELQERAIALAKSHGFVEEEDAGDEEE